MSKHDGRFGFVPEWLLDSGVSDRAKLVYAALTLYADYETDEAWPSRRALAERIGCSRRSITRALTELVECGAVKRVERRRHDGSLTSNSYRVLRKTPTWARVPPPMDTGDHGPLDTDVQT